MTTETLEKKQQTIPLSQINDMGFQTGQAFALLRTAAQFLSESDIIPKQFQGNINNCAVALNMAQRMGADPLMVMQNLYSVYGRPAWSAQFLIATLNTGGQFSKLRYEWTDETDKKKDDYGCRAYAIELETGETLQGPWVTVGLAKAEGWYNRKSQSGGVASKWPTLTELMCMYRAAAFFIRTYCPEIAMGMRTQDEEEEIAAARNITEQARELERTPNMPPAFTGSTSGQSEAPEPSDNGDEPEAQPEPEATEPAEKEATPASGEAYSDQEEDPFKSGELPI